MTTLRAFDLEEKKAYEREMMRRRFEALLKTVAEDNDIDLNFTKDPGASTDGYKANIGDPFTYFDLGFKVSDAITIAMHCTIHEASHILYSGKPKDTLEPAYKKYVPMGYRWKDLFWCIDALEDWRVNHLMEKIRPGIIRYRTKAAKLMIGMITGTEEYIVINKALMLKYFAEAKKYYVPEELEDKFKAACKIFDACNELSACFADVVEYGVLLYNVLYEKRASDEPEETKLRKKKKSEPEEDSKEGGKKSSFFKDPSDVPSFMSSADDDDEDLSVPEDSTPEEPEEPEKDLMLVDKDGEEEELDLDSKPAMMGDLLDEGLEKLEARKEAVAALEGASEKFGGTAYMYPIAPMPGAKVIAGMAKEGLHIDTPIVYVKLPEDKMHDIGHHASWLTYLNTAPVQNRVRTFIGKAANVLKLDNKGVVEQRKAGRLITSRVWRATAVQDIKVFSKTLDLSKGNTAVYILADNSGSMGEIIDTTREAVYMLTRLMIHYNIPCRVVCFDCSTELSKKCVRHVELKDWTETNADGIARYELGEDNRDGLSIHLASLELAQRPEQNKILFVLSDGVPCDGTSTHKGISEAIAYRSVEDTAFYIRKARRLGIQVLGVFMLYKGGGYISGERLIAYASKHKKMYGDELYTISRIEQIPNLLLRALARFTH